MGRLDLSEFGSGVLDVTIITIRVEFKGFASIRFLDSAEGVSAAGYSSSNGAGTPRLLLDGQPQELRSSLSLQDRCLARPLYFERKIVPHP